MPILGGKNKFNAKPPVIRVEKVEVPAPTKPRPKAVTKTTTSVSSSAKASPRASPNPSTLSKTAGLSSSRKKSASPYPSSSSDERRSAIERKRKVAGGSSSSNNGSRSNSVGGGGGGGGGAGGPSQPKFDSDSEAGDDDEDDFLHLDALRKRQRLLGQPVDDKRVLTRASAFKEGGQQRDLSRLIHAADITNLKSCPKAKRVLGATDQDDIRVRLQYPSMYGAENYELLYEDGKIDAIKDIIAVIQFVADVYLPDEHAKDFNDPSGGFIRRLNRAKNTDDLQGFTTALKDANRRIRALVADGTIRKKLDTMHRLPHELVHFFLGQVYDRTVSPEVEKLRQYKNGTDNVYGELLYPLVTKILQEDTRMTSDQVFVDLGSGVGSVVFQAALEIGCESWGCEMMDNPCDFAEAQEKEFAARCKLWGLLPGRVHLERDDFTKNTRIHEVLKRADVVLVNNQAFTPQLNGLLVNMFLDLKKGCKVVSLKSFVNDQGSRNENDVANNILDVERLEYPCHGSVSWTDTGGTYYISRKK